MTSVSVVQLYFFFSVRVKFPCSSIMADGVNDEVNTVAIYQGSAVFQTCLRNLVRAPGSSIRHQEAYNQLHQVLLLHLCSALRRLCPFDAHDPRPWR